jgi:hypothetical protein
MFMPVLLRNFLYESPNSGSWLGDFMMVSAARELHVSAALSRRLFWTGESSGDGDVCVCGGGACSSALHGAGLAPKWQQDAARGHALTPRTQPVVPCVV